MKRYIKYRNLWFYILITGAFGVILYFFTIKGQVLEAARQTTEISPVNPLGYFRDALRENVLHPMAILLLQIITIILFARMIGFLVKRISQPMVIGEILAGIILGPSVLGWLFPDIFLFLFPIKSLINLQFLSQIGLILFMFVIGMELDLKIMKDKAGDAVVISHASIIVPFGLGIWLAYLLYDSYAPAGIRFIPFALFTGIAMSITAFPVLARIVQEKGLSKTRLGTISLICAAANDIMAWCMLAIVIAIVKAGTFFSALFTISLAITYVIIMIRVIRPFLKQLGDIHPNRETLTKPVVAIFIIVLLCSSYITEIIGIHALFGAFMAGAIMPVNVNFRRAFTEKIEDVSVVLLLPLFFVFTGLRTQIGLLNSPELWLVCGMIILVAVSGKFAGSALAAKFVGLSWSDSFVIGSLMNTRGLMELVVLNIGYDLGILSPEIFAMMVIMALFTTFMTGPSLSLINILKDKIHKLRSADVFHVLIAFGMPATGGKLLRLAHLLTRSIKSKAEVTVLHLAIGNNLNIDHGDDHEKESFSNVTTVSDELSFPVIKRFMYSSNIQREIVQTANRENYDLLLVGAGKSIYEGSLLGRIMGATNKFLNPEKIISAVKGREKLFPQNYLLEDKIRYFIDECKCQVGIFIDRYDTSYKRVIIPLTHASDIFLLDYAGSLVTNKNIKLQIISVSADLNDIGRINEKIDQLKFYFPERLEYIELNLFDEKYFNDTDLLLASFGFWKLLSRQSRDIIDNLPSALIIRP